MKIVFSSQRREMLLFLATNMAAVTSRSVGDHVPFSFLELSYSRKPFDSEQKNESKRSSRRGQELTFLTYAYDLKCFVLYVMRNGHVEYFVLTGDARMVPTTYLRTMVSTTESFEKTARIFSGYL